MVSFDYFRLELQTQLGSATARGAIDILVNAGDLYRCVGKAHGSSDGMLLCCDAMQAEIMIGDTLVVEDHDGGGMTVRYQLPRPQIQNGPSQISYW